MVCCAKVAETIEMLFGFWASMGPRNHVLDGGSDRLMGRGSFEGEVPPPIVIYRDALP